MIYLCLMIVSGLGIIFLGICGVIFLFEKDYINRHSQESK